MIYRVDDETGDVMVMHSGSPLDVAMVMELKRREAKKDKREDKRDEHSKR